MSKCKEGGRSVVTSVAELCKVDGSDDDIDELDTHEWDDHATDPVNQHVALQDLCGAERAEFLFAGAVYLHQMQLFVM